ncbi:PHB depolymerase family esterase [Roseomonas sp. 18066]|uniref:extracellular catalytic domain type 1 short-chain-length polyhydroxyalkanoate depolymerase n=1 Tax=Roseomonas sp. 18066 TaxID=2681412 RepID=UPI001359A1D6|nr:PHB depolymerase family esterase [Roseomonas sp. 18066]
MTFPRRQTMADALRLTRSGQLQQATALLQGLFQPAAPEAATPPASVAASLAASPGKQGAAGRVIDLTLQRQGGATVWAMPRARPGATGPDLPPGAEFRALTYDGPQGSRHYRLYVPARKLPGAPGGAPGGAPAPLLVMLHGCTQTPEDFAAGTAMNALAEAAGCFVAYPAQPGSANPQKCWNWFNAGDQQRDRGEPALIAGITRQVMRDHAIDPGRVYVAGLSAGGAAAAILGIAYPELYAAIGVHSGLACGAARDMPSAFAAMRQGGMQQGGPASACAGSGSGSGSGRAAGAPRLPRAIVFHADQDGTVHPRNGEQVLAQFGAGPALEVELEEGQVPGGHRYRVSRHRDAGGATVLEHWLVRGGGHAWSGGQPAGSYTDPRGPDASRAMLRFFLDHPRAEGAA